MLPVSARQWIDEHFSGGIRTCNPIRGGNICNSYHITTHSNDHLFVKTHASPPRDFFQAEAEGLKTIANTHCIRVPEVLSIGVDYLLMEYVSIQQVNTHFWENLGRQLACMHSKHGPRFGFPLDNYCGETPQKNDACEDGYFFFAEYRLNYQALLARQKGFLSTKEVDRIEQLGFNLPSLIPKQPASLLHGDLWAGNVVCCENNEPMLVDPAVYRGWAEADLAMTKLFGGFSPHFYKAYEEYGELESDWEKRVPIYNLYHLLNHLNLFGTAYYRQVMAVIDRFID